MKRTAEELALLEGARSLGIAIDREKMEKFLEYERLLEEWNAKLNLVRYKGRMELYTAHFLDSLWCAGVAGFPAGAKVLDLGSGAGLPGIPLKICFPEASVYLLESQKKKCLFLEAAVEKLGLKGCFVVNRRAEIYARDEKRGFFDVVVSRAVASLAVLLELALPLLSEGGRMVALKGRDIEEEVRDAEHACEVLGGRLVEVVPYSVAGADRRHAVAYEKVGATPEEYPRRPGMPQKRPLTRRQKGGFGDDRNRCPGCGALG